MCAVHSWQSFNTVMENVKEENLKFCKHNLRIFCLPDLRLFFPDGAGYRIILMHNCTLFLDLKPNKPWRVIDDHRCLSSPCCSCVKATGDQNTWSAVPLVPYVPVMLGTETGTWLWYWYLVLCVTVGWVKATESTREQNTWSGPLLSPTWLSWPFRPTKNHHPRNRGLRCGSSACMKGGSLLLVKQWCWLFLLIFNQFGGKSDLPSLSPLLSHNCNVD